MTTIDELLQAIDASIKSVDYTLGIVERTQPKSHKTDLVKSQLEVAREILVKARGYGAGRSSGQYDARELVGQLPPKKP